MTLHLIKLCVGADSVEDLSSWQAERLKARRQAGEKKHALFHRTFQMPKRREELLAGGSLYWVIKGVIQVRQPLLDITEGTREDGTPCCFLWLKKDLITVRPTPRRAFQGWRYLSAADVPEDLKGAAASDVVSMPPKMRKDLADLGPRDLPILLQYRTHVKDGSMHNTPNTFGIYVIGEVFKWIKAEGGLAAMAERNEAKGKLIYDYLDASPMFTARAQQGSRSLMNVCFNAKSEELERS